MTATPKRYLSIVLVVAVIVVLGLCIIDFSRWQDKSPSDNSSAECDVLKITRAQNGTLEIEHESRSAHNKRVAKEGEALGAVETSADNPKLEPKGEQEKKSQESSVESEKARQPLGADPRTKQDVVSQAEAKGDEIKESYKPDLPPRPAETANLESLSIKEKTDLGFPFNPEQWPGRTMRLHNESKGPVAVSFHGEDVSHVRLNGQPVEAGRKYILDGEAELRADRHVGVHLRSLDGSEKQPAPDGPG